MKQYSNNSHILSLHGAYYGHNFGDILLMSIFSKWMKECDPRLKVNLPFSSTSNCSAIGADSKGLEFLARSRGLIYGGGGYFGEPPYSRNFWALKAVKKHMPAGYISKKLGKPYAIVGVGAGPISNPVLRKLFVNLCKSATLLVVRDNESRDYIAEYGVNPSSIRVSADAALTVTMDDIPEAVHQSMTAFLEKLETPYKIGVHLQYPLHCRNMEERIIKELFEFATHNTEMGFVLFTDVPNKRREVLAFQLNQIIPNRSLIVPYTDSCSLISMISLLDLVVTSKLHVGIVASALGKPVVSVPFHAKTKRFYKQINSEDFCTPIEEYKEGDLIERLNERVANGSIKYNVPEQLSEEAFSNKHFLQYFIHENCLN